MDDSSRDFVISIRNLAKMFPDREGNPVRVLGGIRFDVLPGETLVIMGGSGCGKSTLLNCLIGELTPEQGEILYQTRAMDAPADLLAMNEDELNELRMRFGILFQSGALFNSMTVAENVALPLKEHSYVDPSIIDIVVTLKLEQVHMRPHRDKMPSQLSGGQKKRAGLARATALDPEILFYDEPSAGLDPVTSAAIDELIMDLSRKLKVTSVVVTHEMDSAFRIADRMVMLDRGRVVRIGSRREFEVLRDTPPEQLASDEERLIHQFLRGDTHGPLTDVEGMSEYEKWILAGE
ncbi:MAG TPA: ATP-binding cassette domain-containing protein [Phycisphaerae bacterium]|nr:ATP-binding cassette domain-containing protein [Phycisphaerae bacterium]